MPAGAECRGLRSVRPGGFGGQGGAAGELTPVFTVTDGGVTFNGVAAAQ